MNIAEWCAERLKLCHLVISVHIFPQFYIVVVLIHIGFTWLVRITFTFPVLAIQVVLAFSKRTYIFFSSLCCILHFGISYSNNFFTNLSIFSTLLPKRLMCFASFCASLSSFSISVDTFIRNARPYSCDNSSNLSLPFDSISFVSFSVLYQCYDYSYYDYQRNQSRIKPHRYEYRPPRPINQST